MSRDSSSEPKHAPALSASSALRLVLVVFRVTLQPRGRRTAGRAGGGFFLGRNKNSLAILLPVLPQRRHQSLFNELNQSLVWRSAYLAAAQTTPANSVDCDWLSQSRATCPVAKGWCCSTGQQALHCPWREQCNSDLLMAKRERYHSAPPPASLS